MFQNHTVFVLGAGANAEVGMPVGEELANRISRSLHFEFDGFSQPIHGVDSMFLQHIRRLATSTNIDINSYLSEARLISTGILHSGSVDEYLFRHADKRLHAPLGKLAIIYQLVQAERDSKLYRSENARPADILSSTKGTWLHQFAHQLCVGRTASQINKLCDGITIINFNYDRCLQRYLSAFIQQAYHVDDAEARYVLGGLTIHQPYGSLGTLDPQQKQYVPFGAAPGHFHPEKMLDNIRTFTEHQVGAIHQSGALQEAIRNASNVVFLGFGFHKQNLDLLTPPTSDRKSARQVIATAHGLSEPNAQDVEKRLGKLASATASTISVERELKAADLLRNYRMTLST